MAHLVLASASPRRAQLLSQIAYDSIAYPVDIDETPAVSEQPISYVERMAREKLDEALKRLLLDNAYTGQDLIVLSGDTVCIQDQRILVKPEDYEDFESMMSSMSDAVHTVATAFALGRITDATSELLHLETVQTKVYFRSISTHEMREYWRSGEPQDKAGGYGIQGLGAMFVKGIEGSYSNVVGLPLMEVDQALLKAGIERNEVAST